MVASTVAAAISPYWISYSWANLEMPTGTVAVADAVRFRATENSFHEKMKARMPAATRPGTTSGSTTLIKASTR